MRIPKILLVDDNPGLLKLNRAIFDSAGYDTITATDGIKGLEVLSKSDIDLIVSDILMPNMDGYIFCYNVRTYERYRNIPILIYTATCISGSDEALATRVGADGFIRKPASMNLLLDKASSLLARPEKSEHAICLPEEIETELRRYNSKLVVQLEEKNNELEEAKEQMSAINTELQSKLREIHDYKYALDESAVIAITDQKGIIKYVNDNFCRISRYSSEELIGQDHRIVNSGYHSKEFFRDMWHTIANGKVWKGEIKNKAKDDTYYWMLTTIIPFLNDLGKPLQYLAIRIDITLFKKAEESLRQIEQEVLNKKLTDNRKIARAIIKAQEGERHHLGLELHDNINQILAAVKMNLNWIAEEKPEVEYLIKRPEQLVSDCINELRVLSGKFVIPPKDVHLKELVQSALAEIFRGTNIKVRFEYDVREIAIEENLKLNVYRVIQESINNIKKHAAAENIYINMQSDKINITILVADDGVGFDLSKKRDGIGLSNIINRVESFNGEVNIESSPGNGCKTIIKIPLK